MPSIRNGTGCGTTPKVPRGPLGPLGGGGWVRVGWPLAPFGPLGPLALAAPKGEVLNIQNGARTNHPFGIAFGAQGNPTGTPVEVFFKPTGTLSFGTTVRGN